MTMTKLATTALVLMLGACGSSSNSSVSTSIPGTKVLNTLTPAEAATLCMDLGKSVSDTQLKDGACKLSAFFLTAFSASGDTTLTDAQLKTMCTQSYTACQKAPADDGGTDSCMQPSASCTATVAELTTCIKDAKASLLKTFASIPSCSAITRASLASADDTDGGTTPMDVPSCTTVQTKCPELLASP